MLKIAITGHRNLLNEKEIRENIALSLQYFQKIDTDLQAISALAVGADTIFAEEANRLNIPVRYILPFELEDYQKDFTSAAQLNALEDLLAKNNNKYEVESTLKDTNQETKNEAYLAVGKRLVDECDILVAVWDGQDAQGKGGTGDIVAYAREEGKEFHIIEALRPTSTLTEEHRLLNEYDTQAIQDKDKFTRVWAWGLRFAVVAVILFAIGLNFSKKHIPEGYPYHFSHAALFIIACLEISFLFISAYLLIYRAKKLKNSFLEFRRNAEVLRSIKHYKEATIALPKLENERYMYDDAVLRLEDIAIQNPPNLTNLPNAKRKVWVLAEDQIKYHMDKRIPRLRGYEEQLHFWFTVLKRVFFGAVILKFFIEVQEFFCWHIDVPTHFSIPFLNCIVIIVPSIYAALEGVGYFGEYKKNISISTEIAEKLNKFQNKMSLNTEKDEFLDETTRLRKVLELENIEWVKRLFDFHFGPQI
jgi:hypothetical protein